MTPLKLEEAHPELIVLVAERFRFLADPQRLRLIQQLRDQEQSVSALSEQTGILQPSVSKHLKMLHDAGILRRRTEGSQVLYRLDDPSILRLCELMCVSLERRRARQVEQLERIWADRDSDVEDDQFH